MPPTWLETASFAVLLTSVVCALVIVADLVGGRRQKMAIMNLVWPITALYMGPFGLWAYWSLGRSPNRHLKDGQGQSPSEGAEAEHDREKGNRRPFWQTVFIATSHCGAGCTVGDTIGETAIFLLGVTLFGSTLLTAYLVDFTLAYLLGILFQYFTIAPMRNLGLRDGLIAAAKADTISLVAFEVGMFAIMAVNQLLLFTEPPKPNSATYWFLMQIAMIVGFATSYPANWYLVRAGLKEAM
jgi:hypothetical protein